MRRVTLVRIECSVCLYILLVSKFWLRSISTAEIFIPKTRIPTNYTCISVTHCPDLSEMVCNVDSQLARTSVRGDIARRGFPMEEDQVHRTRKRIAGKGGSWAKGFLSRGSSRSGRHKLPVDAGAKSVRH